MSDLEFAVDELSGLGATLGELASEIEHDAKLQHVDRSHVCSRLVVDALNSFANDWNDRRDVLVSEMREVGKLASGSADAFSEVDSELAAKIRDAVKASS